MPLSELKTTDAATTNRHPLNNFWGNLQDINDYTQPPSQRNTNPNARNRTFIKFKFTDLEIIEANEPYNFPVTEIDIQELNIPGNAWEIWKESVRKCGFSGDLNNLIDKRMHWQWSSAMLNLPVQGQQGIFAVQPGFCWQVVEIEGVENTSSELMDKLVDIANGKDASTFKSSFMMNNDIRGLTGYPNVMTSVTQDNMLSTLVIANKLTVDSSGIYHKV